MVHLLLVLFWLVLVVSGQPLFKVATRSDSAPYPARNNVPARHNVPAYMMQRYLMLSKQNTDKMSQNYDTVRHINGKKMFSNLGSLKLFYDLSGVSKNEHIVEDQLHIYLNHIPNVGLSSFSLEVKDLFSRRLISQKHIELSWSSWHEVSLRGWTRRWSRSPRLNRGIKIVVRSRDGKIIRRNNPLFHKKPVTQFSPYLLLYCRTKSRLPSLYLIMRLTELSDSTLGNPKILDSKPKTGLAQIRNPRSIRNTSCNYIMVVMSVTLDPKYGALISRARNTTKKCIGSCASRPSNNSSNCDSRVQDCCVPSLTKQFPVIYVDKLGNFILKVIPNAIVEQCSCLSAFRRNKKP